MKKTLILTLLITCNCFGYFRENSTLLVPSEYATIQDALNELDEKPISREVIITIKIADGTYYINEAIAIGHPNASQIQIIGNTSTPSSCVLNFNSSTDGFTVSNSTSLGFLDGLTISGTGNYGVLANQSSNISIGENTIISGFSIGIFAANSSTIKCSNVTIQNASNTGINATSGSHITAIGSIVNNCTKGIFANMNSSIQCDSSTISNCSYALYAANGAYMHALSILYSSNTQNQYPTPNINGNWNSYIRTQ